MSEFEIEDGVPIPGRKGGIKNRGPWPWPNMKVEQSVFFTAKEGETATTIRYRINPHAHSRRSDKKFASRWMKHEGKFGLRVWRIE